jgi:hypothetical protein
MECIILENHQKKAQKMKKYAETIVLRYMECIVPRCQDVKFKQICTILEKDQNASYHDGIHRSTMVSCETPWHDGNLSHHDRKSPNPPENYK